MLWILQLFGAAGMIVGGLCSLALFTARDAADVAQAVGGGLWLVAGSVVYFGADISRQLGEIIRRLRPPAMRPPRD